MTRPVDTDDQLSGRAADAVADMHDELQRRYTGLNTAEAELAEALLTARATSEAGRRRLEDIQRQVIEAINNPVNALDTPAGERQFLIFLRGKVAEIQSVVDDGELTARDQADLTRALANGYLSDAPTAAPPLDRLTASAPAPQPTGAVPAAAMTSPLPAFGGLPQASATPSPGIPGALGAPTSPLAGLASLLAGQQADPPEGGKVTAEHDADDDATARDAERDRTDDDDPPATPDDAPQEDAGPAQTRPAAS